MSDREKSNVKNAKMKPMTVTEFKVHAHQVIRELAHSREALVITEWGRPVVQVVPSSDENTVNPGRSEPGQLAHLLAFEKDIVSPLGWM